ncbi:MAG: protein kinase [Gemmatimonadetes bacterium]|nr:protein kinase [Gemmatimonadota bacterium]
MNTPPPSDLVSALVDRYAIERELGSGGMATVYLAEDIRHHRKVAIKVLHPELSAVIGSERFLKEIELTANLQHPHILPLFDSGDVNGQLYYVMPFVEGETLRGRLNREQQLPVADALRIAREAADALGYAHKRGIVHRDIKPENILLHDGHALVVDFGIALAVQQAGAGRLTQTGLSLGTPQYMSPEQAMGERTIDSRADIYALGVVTYEMLAGEAPFTGPTAQAIIARAMTERPRSLVGVRESVSPSIDRAVMTALAKLPADRFATAGEYVDALMREGALAPEAHAMQAAPGAGRRSRVLPVATLAAGLLAGAVVAGLLMKQRAEASGASAPRFWSITLPDSAPFTPMRDQLGQFVRSLDISQDAKLIVWSSATDSASHLWQMRTDLGASAPLAATSGAILPTISPDGRSMAFAVDTQVRRLDLSDGTVTRVGTQSVVDGLAWRAYDRILAYDYSYSSCLRSATLNGGKFIPFPSPQCASANGGVFAHVGSDLHVISAGGSIALLDAATARVRKLRQSAISDTTDAASLVTGETPLLIGEKVLLFLRDSTLFAAPLDLKSARITGEARQILTGIRHEAFSGAAQISLSANGTLVWARGGDGAVARFVFVSPGSTTSDPLQLLPTTVSSYALSDDGQRLAYSVTLPGNTSVLRIVDLRRNVTDSTRFPVEVQVANWVDAGSAISVLLSQSQGKGRRYGIVRELGGRMKLDTASALYYASSRDGRIRCSPYGTMFPADAPEKAIRFDRRGNWCRFSPDGRSIAWDSQAGLFVAPTDSTAERARRKVGPAGANEARWSRDGRELVYRTGDQWFAVPSQPSATGALTSPRLVLRGVYNQAFASWDMAADGRLLLLQGPPATRATHLNVITNFPRYVEEKLGAAVR